MHAMPNPEQDLRADVYACADSFLNWRIYWLALAWLIEETVRYGLLFWYALLPSHIEGIAARSSDGNWPCLACPGLRSDMVI